MTTRQLLLLGGTALVLAACADSTAPGTQMRSAGVSAFAKDSTKTSGGTTTMTTSSSTTECRGGYVVVAGRTDSTQTCEEY